MMAMGRRGAVVTLAALLLVLARPASLRAVQDAPRALLPADGEAPGWTREGEPQEFAGEDLYIYIDGGAEIYEEYGFRRVAVQDYRNASGKEISLEVFEMETPEAAFGIFTFKRSGEGKPLALGGGAELEDYYLNFWKGRFLVTLTGFDETAETVAGLGALARVLDLKIKDGGKPPDLVSRLPQEGLRPGSVKHLKGLLGLNNLYPFYTARGLAFKDAVRALYDGGETLLILDYGSAEARRAAWLELRAGLDGSGRFERPDNDLAEAVVFRDGKGRFMAIAEAGARLAVGIHTTLERALATAARVR